ncbi:MAG: restriction endonuclease subunit R, partial [Scytonema sp. PMC 1069.18]|nr:restriction endonuclease subunit R [Scytonema sp. PMC 1069.18]
MINTIPAENITLEQLREFFGLELVEDNLFPEWQSNLPELSNQEKELLNQIKAGYINLRNYPPFLENTVNTV